MFQLNADEFADLKSQIVTRVWVVSGVPRPCLRHFRLSRLLILALLAVLIGIN